MRKRTQTDVVVELMEKNGGYSSLRNLYEMVPTVQDVEWKTKTFQASIRRIVQDPRYFFRIKPGLWALKEYRDALPRPVTELIEVENADGDNKKKDSNRSHYYYQGLLVEIGNANGYTTYVPAQDKNQAFIDKTLKEIASTHYLPQFTYTEVLNRIKSIDVIWLNPRKYPAAVFEVEHSTDFFKSITKFMELENFTVKMFIVAPKARKKQFDEVLCWHTFDEVKKRIKFWDYEDLGKAYEHCMSRTANEILAKLLH